MDPHGGSDVLGIFYIFLKKTADVLAPRLIVAFRRLVHLGNFHTCWIQATITLIPKGPLYSSVANFPPIFIISVLSKHPKVFERLNSVRLERFLERSGVLPTPQYAYQKGMRTCDSL